MLPQTPQEKKTRGNQSLGHHNNNHRHGEPTTELPATTRDPLPLGRSIAEESAVLAQTLVKRREAEREKRSRGGGSRRSGGASFIPAEKEGRPRLLALSRVCGFGLRDSMDGRTEAARRGNKN